MGMSIAAEVAKMCLGEAKPRATNKRADIWTEAEESILREHYESGGTLAVQALLPHRSRKGILLHAFKLGLVSRKAFVWHDANVAILREHYPRRGAAYVAELTGATLAGVKHKASKLGVAHNRRQPVAPGRRKPERKADRYQVVPDGSQPGMRIAPRPFVGEPIITSATKVTICPSGQDMRFRVTSAPRVVDSAECRDWVAHMAKAA